jgi:hypothetical protein
VSTQIIVTHQAASPEGMTLRELHDLTRDMLDRNLPGDQLIRVRTKLAANKHGAAIKSITATSGEAR